MHDRIGAGTVVAVGAVLALTWSWTPAFAQDVATSGAASRGVATTAEWESAFVASTSELRDLVSRYSADRSALQRRWDVEYSAARRDRMREFYESWQGRLDEIDQLALGVEGRIDYVLLQNDLLYRLRRLDREAETFSEMAALLPFAQMVADLDETRRRMEPIDPARTAAALDSLIERVDELQDALEASLADDAGNAEDSTIEVPAAITAFRAAGVVEDLGENLEDWYEFYAGYDPLFTWWVEEPYTRAAEELESYREFLREEIVGIKPEGEEDGEEPIVGDPIGSEAIDVDLAHEMLAYSPAELIEIAEREYAWCVDQLELAAGTKVHKVQALSDDLAMALKTPSVRIVAPLPGKSAVGIEVPNKKRALVRLSELFQIPEINFDRSRIPVLLGKDSSGSPVVVDIADMPHLLLAGATGAGKTVCLNTIIMSMLMTQHPNDLKLLLVDPKMVEMAIYKDIPHLISPVVTDMKRAPDVLNWAATKMDERYDVLAEAGVRSIVGYNSVDATERADRNENDLPEPGTDRVVQGVIYNDLTAGPDRVYLFETSVSPANACRQY